MFEKELKKINDNGKNFTIKEKGYTFTTFCRGKKCGYYKYDYMILDSNYNKIEGMDDVSYPTLLMRGKNFKGLE